MHYRSNIILRNIMLAAAMLGTTCLASAQIIKTPRNPNPFKLRIDKIENNFVESETTRHGNLKKVIVYIINDGETVGYVDGRNRVTPLLAQEHAQIFGTAKPNNFTYGFRIVRDDVDVFVTGGEPSFTIERITQLTAVDPLVIFPSKQLVAFRLDVRSTHANHNGGVAYGEILKLNFYVQNDSGRHNYRIFSGRVNFEPLNQTPPSGSSPGRNPDGTIRNAITSERPKGGNAPSSTPNVFVPAQCSFQGNCL